MSIMVMNSSSPDKNYSSEFIGDRAVVFVAVFVGIQIIAVALRFYARSLTTRRYGLDDWLVAASLLSMIINGALAIFCVKKGIAGYHLGYLEKTNPAAVTLFFKYLLVLSSWFYATSGLSRIALCVLYKHLFPQRATVVVLNVVICLLILLDVGTAVAVLAACRPFSASWATPEFQDSHCINREALFLWCTFPNIIIDTVLLTLPIPIIWRLATTVQLKVALTITFLIGSMGFIATILRFVAFFVSHSFRDPTYEAVNLIAWAMAEPGIGLISACIIMYRPLLKKLNDFCCRSYRSRDAAPAAAAAGGITISWPVTYYRSPSSASGHHRGLRRGLGEDGDECGDRGRDRGIALRDESSLEQILSGRDGRSHHDHIGAAETGRPGWNFV
ncbi:hypothetical protein GGR52DRAFT_590944 [Hypoxylon sp. FL1284]|nr:hypothetical protein GGR52DRAFT_590944 [Hypoxylon sp. FL1284]